MVASDQWSALVFEYQSCNVSMNAFFMSTKKSGGWSTYEAGFFHSFTFVSQVEAEYLFIYLTGLQ
jgi:hypothetical protein